MGELKKAIEKNRLKAMRVDVKMDIIEHGVRCIGEDSGLVKMLSANTANGINRQLGSLIHHSQRRFSDAYPGQARVPVSKQEWKTKGSPNVSRLMDLMELDEL